MPGVGDFTLAFFGDAGVVGRVDIFGASEDDQRWLCGLDDAAVDCKSQRNFAVSQIHRVTGIGVPEDRMKCKASYFCNTTLILQSRLATCQSLPSRSRRTRLTKGTSLGMSPAIVKKTYPVEPRSCSAQMMTMKRVEP